jgi:hypothetical protein
MPEAVTETGSREIYTSLEDVIQAPLIERLKASLSVERIATYLTAAGFNPDRALRLYLWNAAVGEAFHLPVQAVEVALRNAINRAVSAQFGPDWWKSSAFLREADRERKADIETATNRIRSKNKPLITPQMVATLTFGFWTGILQPRYNPPLWGAQLRPSFPNLPLDKSRYDLSDAAKRVADLRNRIWHHEPIFRMDLLAEFGATMKLLGWVCPVTAEWIRPHCRVPALVRQKP